MVQLNSSQIRRAIWRGTESHVIKCESVCVLTGFGFPQSFRPLTCNMLICLPGEEDSSLFLDTSDLYYVHIVAVLSSNYVSREREVVVPVRV